MTTTLLERRVPPNSFDAEARTFEATFATGTAVERYDARGAFDEVLDINGMSGGPGVPVLDHHRRGELDAILGEVIEVKRTDGKAIAVVRLSAHNPLSQRLAAELADGMKFGVSVGYQVTKYEETTRDGRRTKIARQWRVREISIVSVPADENSHTRKDNIMSEQVTTAEDRGTVNGEIRSIAKIAKLDQTWIDSQIDASATVEQARAAAFEAMRTRANADQVRTTTAEITTDNDAPEVRAERVGEALFARANPLHQLSEAARPYAYLSMAEIARDCLRTRGVTVMGMSANTLVTRALHTTSDFPLILGDAVGRTLRQGYSAAPSGLKQVGRQTTAKDFRDKHRIALSEAQRLEKTNEHGEFKRGTLAEATETYRLATFGRVFGITRQAIVNDDLGAFSDLARRLGQTAAATEAQLLVDLLTQGAGLGPVMSDTKRLFHADHSNIADSGAVIGVASLSEGRTAMRKQVGLQGEQISVTPKFLVAPAEIETAAEKVLHEISAAQVDQVNPFSGSLTLVVEPRLTDDKRWYLAASPSEIDGLEYAYLEGEEGPQIETRAGFDVDGVETRVRLDFGAGFVDWRSWFTNEGAAEGGGGD